MKRLGFRIFLAICTLSVVGVAAAQEFNYHHLSVEEGLSHYSALAVYIDENNLVWVGTEDGLNLWSGYDFTVFHTDTECPDSLFCDNIQRLMGNRNGKLWVQTLEGIAEYDMAANRFQTLCTGKKYRMCYADDLYLAHGNRIERYRDGHIEPVCMLGDTSVGISTLHVEPENGRLLVGTAEHGLYLLQNSGGSSVEEHRLLDALSITCIFRDSQQRYWIGTTADGLYLSEDGLATFTRFRSDPHDPHSISSDFVRTVCEDAAGRIYVGTFDGFNIYDPDGRRFRRHTGLGRYTDSAHKSGIESTSVWCMVTDAYDNIWLGTYFEGLYCFHPEHSIYRKHTVSDDASAGLSSPIVSGITEDADGNLYIATEGGGFCHYDRRTGRWRQVRHLTDFPTGRYASYNNIKSICYDPPRRVLWLGTHMGGLFRYDERQRRLRQYLPPAGSDKSESRIVRQILRWDDRLLLATHAGLWLFHPESGRFSRLAGVLHTDVVSDLCLSRDGRTLYWAGDKPLLHCYDPATQKVRSYRFGTENALDGNRSVSHLHEDSTGRIWVCTENDAVYLFHPDEQRFERLDNFTGNKICSVEELADDRFIVAASNGISVLDYTGKRLLTQQTRHEMPLQMINQDALFIASDSTVFVGGYGGLISFRVDDIAPDQSPTRIYPMRMTCDGREVSLTETVNPKTSVLRLPASKVSTVSFKYAAPNLAFVSMRLEYRLHRDDNDQWLPMPNDNTITLVNLLPAWYDLQVRAIDRNGCVLAMNTCTLRVVPSWYQRWWAYLLFAALGAALLLFCIRAYTAHLQLRTSLEYERKRSHDQEELDKTKLRFFTNVAHEFRTPLTIVVGHLDSLLLSRIADPHLYKKLMSIHRNIANLRRLTDDLLDFRKQEQGFMKLHAAEHDLVRFLREHYVVYREYAQTRRIDLHFESQQEQLAVWFDESLVQKVIDNLLSNALKYTEPDKGRIVLSVASENGYAVIRVEDNGIGIAPDQLDDIFKRFYQADSTHGGSGIGLALTKGLVEMHGGEIDVQSAEHRGSVFTVRLPLGRAHLTNDQITAKAETEESLVFNEKRNSFSDFEGGGTPEPETDINDPTAAPAEAPCPSDQQPVAGVTRYKALLVEDNRTLRELLYEIFAPHYDVTTAENGFEALEAMKHGLPDIIVSDIVMPRMDGFELCKAVKSNFDTSHIPFVALTAYTSVENNLRGYQTGADDYVTKPFNAAVLLARCNNLINNRIVLQKKFRDQQHVEPENLVYTPLDQAFVKQAMEIIDRHIRDPKFNIGTFAKEMCIARTKLFVKLKTISGQTPSEFIMTIKLRRAADMLLNRPEYNVSDICELLGFNTLRYFSKCFKDKYRISPLRYRHNRGRIDPE